MKKINWKDKTLLPIVLIAVVFIAIVLILVFSAISKKNVEESKKEGSGEQKTVFYNEPYKDATKITNETLAREHCVDDICVKDLVIYYTKSANNIEFNLFNKGKKKATGYLKIVFDDKAMTVAYNSLESNKSSPYTIQLGKEKLEDTSDFIVRELTGQELEKLKK